MSTNQAYARKSSVPKKLAVYFRLTVDIIFRMRNYRLLAGVIASVLLTLKTWRSWLNDAPH